MRIFGLFVLGVFCLMASDGFAVDLRDCDAKNVARSTAAKATGGVGTGCGAKKEAKNAKKGATGKAKNVVDRVK